MIVLSHPRVLVIGLGVAAAQWAVAWGFIGQTGDGAVAVLGISEGGWRAMLLPALLVLVVATGRWALHGPSTPSATALAGVTLLLVGNVLEVGLVGRPTPLADLGRLVAPLGAALAIAGMGLALGSAAAAASGRPGIGIAIGLLTAVAVAVAAVAVPAAAALAVLPLADRLWQAPGGGRSVTGVGVAPASPSAASGAVQRNAAQG